jgi:hypothetical protein
VEARDAGRYRIEHEDAPVEATARELKRMWKKLKWAAVAIIGGILVVPLFRDLEETFDNVLDYLFAFVGLCLLLLGLAGLLHRPQPDGQASYGYPRVAFMFRFLALASVVLTVVGTLWLIFLARPGSASGVPIAMGLMAAWIFYALGKLARGKR